MYNGYTPTPTAPTVRTKLEDCRREIERLEIEAKEAQSWEFWQDIMTVETHVSNAIKKLQQMADKEYHPVETNDNGVQPQHSTPAMPAKAGGIEDIF